MTFEELVNLPRVSRGGGLSQLGLWIDAVDSGDGEMGNLVMSAMAASQTLFESKVKRKPQVTPSDTNESDADRSRRLNRLRSCNG